MKYRSPIFLLIVLICSLGICHGQLQRDVPPAVQDAKESFHRFEGPQPEANASESKSDKQAAARRAANDVQLSLESNDWTVGRAAINASDELNHSELESDLQLAHRTESLTGRAIQHGLDHIPDDPTARISLLDLSKDYLDRLLHDPNSDDCRRAAAILDAWQKAAPDDYRVKLKRLNLCIEGGDRSAINAQGKLVMEETRFDQETRNFAASLTFWALIREPIDVDQLRSFMKAWRTLPTVDRNSRINQLWFDAAYGDNSEVMDRCAELLNEPDLTKDEIARILNMRLVTGVRTGRIEKLTKADLGSWVTSVFGKRVGSVDSGVLLLLAALVAMLHLSVVAFTMRRWHKKPPGFLLTSLWFEMLAYAPLLVFAPPVVAIVSSMCVATLMIWSVRGSQMNLGYFNPPTAGGVDVPVSPVRWIGVCLLCWGGLLAVATGYQKLFQIVMGRGQAEHPLVAALTGHNPLDLVSHILVGGMMIPLLEEIIFRGITQDWLTRRLGVVWSVLIVSVVFGAMHGLEALIPAGCIGLCCSLLRLHYRSLWPSIALHVINNSLSVLLLYFSGQ